MSRRLKSFGNIGATRMANFWHVTLLRYVEAILSGALLNIRPCYRDLAPLLWFRGNLAGRTQTAPYIFAKLMKVRLKLLTQLLLSSRCFRFSFQRAVFARDWLRGLRHLVKLREKL